MLATFDLQTDFARLLQLWDANEELRRDIKTLKRWANGDQIRDTPSMPHEDSAHQRRKPRFAAGFLNALLSKLSYLYAKDPARDVTKAGIWESILWDWGPTLSAQLQQVDRDARLTGTVLAVMAVGSSEMPTREDTRTPDGIEMWTLTPDKWVALEHPNDPRYPAAILALWGESIVSDKSGDGAVSERSKPLWLYLDDEIRAYIVGDNLAEARIESHGYGVLPAAVLPNTLEVEELHGRRAGGSDLLLNLKSINRMFEEIAWTGLLQRGQPVGVGKKLENEVLAPDSIIIVEDVGGFTIVGNNANIPAMLETLNAMLEGVAISVGLPPGTLTVREAQQPSNAGVVAATQLELEQDRVTRERIARIWERKIHQVAARVWESVDGQKLSDDVKVTYSRMPDPLTHGEKLAEAKFLREQRALDRVGAAMFVQPHKSRREIERELDAAAAEFEREQALQIAIAGHASDLPAVEMETASAIVDQSTEDTNV